MKTVDVVVLVHGFCRNATDMYTLKNNLKQWDYKVITVNLPTFFSTLKNCADLLANELSVIAGEIGEPHKIHLVGHSFGGLIIRSLLSNHLVSNLGRCVLIGTPNHGTKLADLVKKIFWPALEIFKPLKALLSGGPDIAPPLGAAKPQIGVIAGNRNNLLAGFFLSKESDGKVEVKSAKLDGMSDFIIVYYNHDELHHTPEVTALVHSFLQTGSFRQREP